MSTEPELHQRTALDLLGMLRGRAVSSVELTEHALARVGALDDRFHAFVRVDADAAASRAAVLDAARTAGEPLGALGGLPTADKDLWQRAGFAVGRGSRFVSPAPAETTDELPRRLDAAGAVVIGATATPEFGLSAYSSSTAHGAVGDPWDATRDPGGSSGGAAVAVAARMLPVAPGNDGGGSIRIPAAATGLVGVKPTRGVIPQGPERPGRLVVPGPLARTTADAALLLSALVDPAADASEGPYLPAALTPLDAPLTIGVLTESPWTSAVDWRLDDEVETAFEASLHLLARLGHHLRPVGLPSTESAAYPEAFLALWAANMADVPAEGHEELLEPLTRWIWERGRQQSPDTGRAALATLEAFTDAVIARFADVDVVVSPMLSTLPVPRAWFGEGEEDFRQQCRFTPFTSFVNVTGLPAVSVPVAMSQATPQHPSLPIGLQVIGRAGAEPLLLSLAARLEAELDWAGRVPPGV